MSGGQQQQGLLDDAADPTSGAAALTDLGAGQAKQLPPSLEGLLAPPPPLHGGPVTHQDQMRSPGAAATTLSGSIATSQGYKPSGGSGGTAAVLDRSFGSDSTE